MEENKKSRRKSKVQENRPSESVASIKKSQIDSYDELEHYKVIVKKRKKRLIARIFIFLLLLIIAPTMIFLTTMIVDKNGKHDFFGFSLYIVISNSMEPEIKINDCVILKETADVSNLSVGTDIGYLNENSAVVVHRIIGREVDADGNVKYVTKGINNNSADSIKVSCDSVVGVKVGSSRVFGNVIVFFRTTAGIIVMFLIFAVIIGGFVVAFRLSEDIRYVEKQE